VNDAATKDKSIGFLLNLGDSRVANPYAEVNNLTRVSMRAVLIELLEDTELRRLVRCNREMTDEDLAQRIAENRIMDVDIRDLSYESSSDYWDGQSYDSDFDGAAGDDVHDCSDGSDGGHMDGSDIDCGDDDGSDVSDDVSRRESARMMEDGADEKDDVVLVSHTSIVADDAPAVVIGDRSIFSIPAVKVPDMLPFQLPPSDPPHEFDHYRGAILRSNTKPSKFQRS
jgi:hypothetical protein